MSDPIALIARASAARLAPELGPGLRADVELALLTRDAAARSGRYVDLVGLGGLIVSVATLAWSVYSDLRRRRQKPTAEQMRHAIHVKLGDDGDQEADAEHLSRIIEVTVSETITSVADHGELIAGGLGDHQLRQR
jgi:hypothetical protein